LDLAIVNGRIRRPPHEASHSSTVAHPGLDSFWRPYAEPAQLFAGDATGSFTEVSPDNAAFCAPALIGRGLLIGDADNDGALDLLTVSLAGPARLARNIAPRGNWLGLRLIDPQWGGRDAFGAEVIVRAGRRTFWRLVQPAFSYACSNDPRVHVGLGDLASAESILVRWPDGTDEQFPGERINQYRTLRKGDGQPSQTSPNDRAPSVVRTPLRPNQERSHSMTAQVASQPTAANPSRPSSPLKILTQSLDPAVSRLIQDSTARVTRTPESADAWGRLGSVLMHYEFVPEASEALAEAERLAPAEPRWPYLRGWLLMAHQPTEAVHALRRAATLAGAHQDACRLRLAQFLEERGQVNDAENEYRRLRVAVPEHPLAHLGLARIAHQRGDALEAERLLTPCLHHPQTRKVAHELLAAVQKSAGQESNALATARHAAALPPDPRSPDPLWDEAAVYRVGRKFALADAAAVLDAGKPQEALLLLESVTRDYPADPDGWYLLAWARNQAQDPRGAEHASREHLRRLPASARGLVQLAVALLGQRRYADALPVLESAGQLRPTWREIHSNLGYANVHLSRPAEAEQHYRQALAIDPAHVPTHTALAELLLRRGAQPEAKRLLQSAASLEPGNPRVQMLLDALR
jgi:tetratricopeptide (TPR) repeat protein